MKRHLPQAVLVSCVLCMAEVLAPLPVAAQGVGLLVVDGGNSRVLRYDGATGVFIGDFVPAGSGGLDTPQDITIGPDGNVYVSSWANGSVKRYERSTGSFLGDFVPSGSGGLANPDQLLFGPDGHLYVSDRFSARVLRYDGLTGAPLGTFVQDNRLFGFVAFTFGPDGNLYASMFNGIQCILRFSGQTGAFLDDFACATDQLSAFSGLAFGSDSRLYASRFHLAQVWRFDGTSGQFLGSLSCPGDQHLDYLAFGPDHRLYVSNVDGNNLSRFDVQTGQCLGVFLTGGGINGCKGFVFLPAAPPIVYCVPKTNSLGCIPTIGFSGTPALSGPDDFAISASNVLNFRPGLMFWGRAASSIPFQGGTRCVAMPFMRTRLQDSEGSPGSDNCSGTYNYELTNEYLVANALNPGDQMYAQYWSRDPFSAPFFTGLTDALHIWIGP